MQLSEEQKEELVEAIAIEMQLNWLILDFILTRVNPKTFDEGLRKGYAYLTEEEKEKGRRYARRILEKFSWFKPKNDSLIHYFKIVKDFDCIEIPDENWKGPVYVAGFGASTELVFQQKFSSKFEADSFIHAQIWRDIQEASSKSSAEFKKERLELLKEEWLKWNKEREEKVKSQVSEVSSSDEKNSIASELEFLRQERELLEKLEIVAVDARIKDRDALLHTWITKDEMFELSKKYDVMISLWNGKQGVLLDEPGRKFHVR